MNKQGLFVKQTEATIKNGAAGMRITDILSKTPTPQGIMMNVLIRDLDGMPSQADVLEADTEVRDIQ